MSPSEPRMTAGSWKSETFTLADDAGDGLFGPWGGEGGISTPPAFDGHTLQDLFGRIEDLLSHTVPADVLQAIENAFQNVIDHLQHIDPPPNFPDPDHLWHEGWTAPPTVELGGLLSQGGADGPSTPAPPGD